MLRKLIVSRIFSIFHVLSLRTAQWSAWCCSVSLLHIISNSVARSERTPASASALRTTFGRGICGKCRARCRGDCPQISLAASSQRSAVSGIRTVHPHYWLLVAGYWILAAGCWLLVTGCWTLNRFRRVSEAKSEGRCGRGRWGRGRQRTCRPGRACGPSPPTSRAAAPACRRGRSR